MVVRGKRYIVQICDSIERDFKYQYVNRYMDNILDLTIESGVDSRWSNRRRAKKGIERHTIRSFIAISAKEDTQGLYLLRHSCDEDPGDATKCAFLRGNTLSTTNTSFDSSCSWKNFVWVHVFRPLRTELATEKGHERVARSGNSTRARRVGHARMRRHGDGHREDMVRCYSTRISSHDTSLMLFSEAPRYTACTLLCLVL